MKPIPVAFHIGPLEVHTYGIGLALTFWFGFTYFERRLRKQRLPHRLVRARVPLDHPGRGRRRPGHARAVQPELLHANPGDILAVWHGGLSSFGGLLVAVPTGIILTRRRCPELPLGRALDLAAPVLMAVLGHGPAARPPAHGGRRRPPDPPVVRHVLRRPAGPAAARADLPGAGGLRRLPDPHRDRAPARPLARRHAPHRLPRRDRARHRHGAVGHRALSRRAPVARRGRPPRLGPGPVGGAPARRRRRPSSSCARGRAGRSGSRTHHTPGRRRARCKRPTNRPDAAGGGRCSCRAGARTGPSAPGCGHPAARWQCVAVLEDPAHSRHGRISGMASPCSVVPPRTVCSQFVPSPFDVPTRLS